MAMGIEMAKPVVEVCLCLIVQVSQETDSMSLADSALEVANACPDEIVKHPPVLVEMEVFAHFLVVEATYCVRKVRDA